MSIRITPTILQDVYSQKREEIEDDFRGIVIPGEVIFASGANLITGHGTYRTHDSGGVAEVAVAESMAMDDSDGAPSALSMFASLSGRLKSVNKLVYVEPPNTRYSGSVGDTVVGRIIEVEQKRWKVDVNSYHLANLSLANVKLPTGELRRKSEDDERAMRSFMREGDLIVAEVREVYRDGSLQLHMPGIRTGRLGEGCVLRLPPSLIRRQKIHRHQLVVPCGGGGDGDDSARSACVGLILGCNGLVWIGPKRGMNLGARLGATISTEKSHSVTGVGLNPVEMETEERVALGRVRNVVLALAACGHLVWETAVLAGCEASFLEEVEEVEGYSGESDGGARITRLLLPQHQRHLVDLVIAKLAAA